MHFLLWIALIGVIVFLLGLLYSKFSTPKATQPASNTISPAPSPLPAPATQDKPAANKSADEVTEMPAPEKTTPTSAEASPKSKSEPAKIVPDAEPVGPAHSKPQITDTPRQQQKPEKSKTPEIKTADMNPAPAAEPQRLKQARNNKADDLTRITGIGKAIQTKLFNAGIFHYDQLADLNHEQTSWINRTIGFAGRAERENWGAQAKKLSVKAATTSSTTKKTTKTAGKTTATKPKTRAKAKTTKKSTTV